MIRRQLVDDAAGIAAVVAADVEEVAHIPLFKAFEDSRTVLCIRLVSTGAQRRRGGLGDPVEPVLRDLLQLDQVVVDDPAHSMVTAVDPLDAA